MHSGPTLEFKLVPAARRSASLSFKSTGVDMPSKNSTALVAAFWNDWAMVVGWIPEISDFTRFYDFNSIPWARSFSAAPRREPARTTTDVVPSPASISWAAESSTNYSSALWNNHGEEHTIRAAGCKTAMCFRIVAPSLVMTTSPVLVWIYHQTSLSN